MKNKNIKIIFLLLCFIIVVSIFLTNYIVSEFGKYTFNDADKIPTEHCAIFLGTSKFLKNGRINQYYKHRIDAAAKLYHNKKCKKIIVSGDNRNNDYNEPLDMKRDLISQGVAESDIVCDFAGTRTLDSIIRFKEVFGQTRGIVISQKFQNSRAIYIAKHKGINLIGFNAQDVDTYSGIKTKIREIVTAVS